MYELLLRERKVIYFISLYLPMTIETGKFLVHTFCLPRGKFCSQVLIFLDLLPII